MRAGCFAEKRVIDLINRRFVPFFFNRGGPGKGHDANASAFVAGQTKNPWAYFAAFSPAGKIVGETELYADKDAVFDWLCELLVANPEYAGASTGEADRADSPGELFEELGDYDAALEAYARAPDSIAARLGELRIARYRGDWARHETLEEAARNGSHAVAAAIDLELERGRRLLAQLDYAGARELLQPLTHHAAGHVRLAEAHFYAGVACWFDGDRDWAKMHWCWVVEKLPDDRLQRRAYIAAAAEAMPYKNPELGGFAAEVGNIGTGHIQNGYQRALRVHRRLLTAFERGDWNAKLERESPQQGSEVEQLAAKLRDGNAYVPANNRVVDRLVKIGKPAVAPLVAQIRNRDGESRGYSAWALGNVLIGIDPRPADALAALDEATRDTDPYVVALSRSGLGKLREAMQAQGEQTESGAGEEQGSTASVKLPHSVTRLVALLEDGNEHRVFNNEVVDRLKAAGKAAIPSLIAAVNDASFPGRGYAAWALSQVLKATGSRDESALAALRAAIDSSDSYVSTLARSGMSTL